jgi:WD40 repeat protein
MHKGWVWNFCSEGETLVSGSWDSTVKLWQVTPTGLQETRKPINLKVAVLATDILGDRIVTGTFDKKVVLLDRREGPRKCTFYRVHTKPVLAVRITERQVWSLSEDQTVVIYDRAAGKRLKKVTIPGQHFPICMASEGHCLWVGDKGGALHLLDTTMDSFDVVESLSSGHTGRVTSLQAGRASLLSASSDGDIRVFRPTRNPGLLTVLRNPDCGEATQISYNEKNQILAAGFANNTVKTWAALPRD